MSRTEGCNLSVSVTFCLAGCILSRDLIYGIVEWKRKLKTKLYIDMIKGISPVQPPDDFTDRVMLKVGLCPSRYGAAKRIHDLLTRPRDLKGFRLLPESITKGQCGFYFILVSLFYLAVGMVFLRSLETISTTGYQAIWLLYQPEFSFAIAIGFAFTGISFISGQPVSVRSARFGIYLYVAAIVINSLILQIDMKLPIVILALLPLTIGSVIIGGFLAYATERYYCNAS